MLQLEQALDQILARVPPPVRETVPLSEAAGRRLFEAVLAQVDLPPFNNSSMDGYAVRSADTKEARPDSPVPLRLQGRVAAGETFVGAVNTGQCVRIFTGAPLPEGADAVVMQEEARAEPGGSGRILILGAPQPGENVRLRGEDVAQGETLACGGDLLTPGRLCLLAAAGIGQVAVAVRPRVALVATGSELREPGTPLQPGAIYESTRVGLAELARLAGAAVALPPLVPDELEATKTALRTAFESGDAVITCGGVSVGETDLVKAAFERLGGTLEIWKVDIKPGKPFAFGRLGHRLLFGLPGNPVSALVTFLLLVRPALLRWQGAQEIGLRQIAATLGESVANTGDRRHFLRVRLTEGKVFSSGLQASHALKSWAEADGLLEVAPRTQLPAGTTVSVSLIDQAA